MISLKRLRLTNLRAFHDIEFVFQSDMSLIAGNNGVGKSTVLDALRIALSWMLRDVTGVRIKPMLFTDDDFRVGTKFLTLEIDCVVDAKPYTFLMNRFKEEYVVNSGKEGQVRGQTIKTSDITRWQPEHMLDRLRAPNIEDKSLAVYFSPRRSLANDNIQSYAATGWVAAYTNTLEERELRLQEFADWWLTREALSEDGLEIAREQLKVVSEAVQAFLNTFGHIHVVREPKTTLMIDKEGTSLKITQLSDGERGVLALVLDLSRRLALANPNSTNPTRDGSAVVLIDELDLHLHPSWQRTIVERLTRTFPNCQFIATTHSPQIISEVKAEQLTLIQREDGNTRTRSVEQAYGLDANAVLEEVMNVASRPEPVRILLDEIEEDIEEGELVKARVRLQELRDLLDGTTGEVARLEATMNRMEMLADAMDTQEG